MTPEGKVKAKIKTFLKQWDVWTDWPVPNGFGKSTLDCQVICNGWSCWIEAKAPGKEMTARQEQLKGVLNYHGVEVFVIDTTDTNTLEYSAIRVWMASRGAKAT